MYLLHVYGEHRRAFALVLCLAGALSACGDDKNEEGGPPSGSGESHIETVGSAGGELTHEGVTLTVPAGALATDTEITMTSTTEDPDGPFVRLSPVYHFEPDGLQFAAPATVRLTFEGSAPAPAIYWSAGEGGFARLESAVDGQAVSAHVTHFSEGFVGAEPADEADAGGLDADAGGGDGGEGPGGSLRPVVQRSWPTTGIGVTAADLRPTTDGAALLGGIHNGPIDFGTGPLPNTRAGFFARFASDGTTRWAISTPNNGPRVAESLPDGGALIATVHEFARVDAEGTDIWRIDFGVGNRRPNEAWTRGIAVDAAGNSLFVGSNNGPADFGGGLIGNGGEAFVAAYDSQGNHLFSSATSGDHSTGNHDVVLVPDGGYYVAGTYNGDDTDFGGGPLPQEGQPGFDQRTHLVKLGANGQHVWSIRVPDGGEELDPIGLTVDSAGDPVVVANFDDGAAIDLGEGPLASEPGSGFAVLTFSATDGALLTTRSWTGATLSRDAIAAYDGTLYLTGVLGRQLDFGTGLIGPAEPEPGERPAPYGYLAVVPLDGSPGFATGYEGFRPAQAEDLPMTIEGVGLAPDGQGGVWWLTRYAGEFDLGDGVVLPVYEDSHGINTGLIRFAP